MLREQYEEKMNYTIVEMIILKRTIQRVKHESELRNLHLENVESNLIDSTTTRINKEQHENDQKLKPHLQTIERHLMNTTTERIHDDDDQTNYTKTVNEYDHRTNPRGAASD